MSQKPLISNPPFHVSKANFNFICSCLRASPRLEIFFRNPSEEEREIDKTQHMKHVANTTYTGESCCEQAWVFSATFYTLDERTP